MFADFETEHFMSMLKSSSDVWKLLDEITIEDVTKFEGKKIDFKFKIMIVYLVV